MIPGSLDRRVALIGLTSAVAGALLAPVLFQVGAEPTRAQPTGPQYVEPTWWDGFAPYDRKTMLAWDFAFWRVEHAVPPPNTAPSIGVPFNAMGGLVLTTMSQPGQNELKKTLTAFIADSHRWQYFPHLLAGLSAGNNPPELRLAIAGAARKVFQTTGTQAFSGEVQQALLTAYGSETDLFIKSRLDSLLSLLGVPH